MRVGNEFELYFNATNGGEITEYFDLVIDPYRSRNLVNLGWKPYYNLRPLFASLFYNPYIHQVLTTGGDPNAMVEVIANTSQYAILQTSSRIMSLSGAIAKDVYGNPIRIHSTWIIKDNNLVTVERIFDVQSYANIPPGWRWYPFHFMRTVGFDYNATYFMFNTTSGYIQVVNDETYVDKYTSFALLPKDSKNVFGVAAPYSNTSIGGDGGHNILIAYKYDELFDATEWRSDNFQRSRVNATELGAVHEFVKETKVTNNKYRTMVNFTHQPIDLKSAQSFAEYFADNNSMASLMQCSVTTEKDSYKPGDHYAFYGSGMSYYNLTRLTARVTVANSSDHIIYRRYVGPGNITAGQTFNLTLLTGTVEPDAIPGEYKIMLQIFSPFGIVIASGNKVITVTTP